MTCFQWFEISFHSYSYAYYLGYASVSEQYGPWVIQLTAVMGLHEGTNWQPMVVPGSRKMNDEHQQTLAVPQRKQQIEWPSTEVAVGMSLTHCNFIAK